MTVIFFITVAVAVALFGLTIYLGSKIRHKTLAEKLRIYGPFRSP